MTGVLTTRKWLLALAAYAVPFILCPLLLPFVGPSLPTLAGGAGTDVQDVDAFIFYQLRLPRVFLSLVVGGSLAMTGAAFQVILRNPLAEPFTLGVTGGAAVGAVLALTVGGLSFRFGPLSSVQFFALAGAGLAMFLVYQLARRPQGISMSVLLLAGVTVSILSGGLVMLIRYLANPHLLVVMDRWLMGGLETIGYGDLKTISPFIVAGIILLLFQMPSLNHVSLGKAMAAGHGVEVAKVQRMTFIGGSLLTAGVVSLAGPIGFVGLIVPHAVRRLSGFDQRVVLPAAFLLGGAFLAVCDTAARMVIAPREIPVGVITALVGGPIFIKILLGPRR